MWEICIYNDYSLKISTNSNMASFSIYSHRFCFFLILRVSPAEFCRRELLDTCFQERGVARAHLLKLWTNGFLGDIPGFAVLHRAQPGDPRAHHPPPGSAAPSRDLVNPRAGARPCQELELCSSAVLWEQPFHVYKHSTFCFNRPPKSSGQVLTCRQRRMSAPHSFRKGRECF